MKASELRQKSLQELQKELRELLREHFNLRMQRGSGQLAHHHHFGRVRKDIARIKSILNERTRASGMS